MKTSDKRFKNSTRPKENKTKEPRDPRPNLNMKPCTQEEINWSKIEKTLRIKLFELCKTRTKKTNPDLLIFYVISGGHDMGNDAGRATTCRSNLKDPWLQTERTKNEGPSEKVSFNGELVWKFQTNKSKNPNHRMENKTIEPRDPEGKNWTWTM